MAMVPCPKCGASLQRRVTKATKRVFYGCTRFMETGCRGSMDEIEWTDCAKLAARQARRSLVRSLDETESQPYPEPTKYDGAIVPTAEFEHPISLNRPGIGVSLFNPPQSYIVRNGLHRKKCNLVITTPTSSGKTAMAEMVIARQFHRGKRAVYVSPLRAVTNEKYQEWTDKAHPFSSRRVSILTGDYRSGPEREKELNRAELILLTSEMLDSRSRKAGNEKNEWLRNVGACVVDEAHLLGTDRGPALEVGLMRFAEESPGSRLIFLSATMPNIDEVKEWLTSLNGMATVVVDLPWRPVELRMHWVPYQHSGSSQVMDERFDMVEEIVRRHYNEGGILVFVHTKRMGREMKDMLMKSGFTCEFHSGELEKKKRHDLENRFRNLELPVLISTSTLAWGVNI